MNGVSEQRAAGRQTYRWRAWFLIVAVPLGFACSDRRQGAPPAVPVTATRAEQRTVPFEITAPGTVEPMQAVAVAPQVTGIVTTVRFREGDEVTPGTVLATIDPDRYRVEAERARSTSIVARWTTLRATSSSEIFTSIASATMPAGVVIHGWSTFRGVGK